MCGIVGQMSSNEDALRLATEAIRHRGPDHTARFHHAPFQLAYNRLAILDRAEGQQPFSTPDQRIHAFCNGEIYNWRELRTQLQTLGHRFHTQCDCEILPAAWLEWGTSLPSKLNGMFALVIHDAANNSLFLARDRCGQKPLYYSTHHKFSFASEIKALAALGQPLQPDPRSLSTWLTLRYLPEPTTLFQNIVTLPAAHWMTVSAKGTITSEPYWTPLSQTRETHSPSTHSNPLDTLDHLTRSAVELALQAETPLAAYLSGGVDSALLAHYLKDLGGNATTVSIGFGSTADETQAAESTAKHLGLPHHSAQLTPDALDDLPRVIQQMDRPIGDTLILAFDHLAKHTASLGCRVALGGEGPDEHFAGYSFQRAFLTAQKLGPLGRPLAAATIDNLPSTFIDKLANFPASLGHKGRKKTSRYLREFSSLPFFEQATRLHSLFEPAEVQSLLHPDLRSEQHPHPLAQTHLKGSSLSHLLALQYQHWLPDWSLIRQDKNTMAHSIEYRAPFLDHRLINFAFTLPNSAKINHGQDKLIWRQLAQRHLPRELTQRPKTPFYLPLEQEAWRKKLILIARDILSPTQLAKQSWLNPSAVKPLFNATEFLPLKQLAALVILQIWANQFSNKTAPQK